MSFLQSSNLHLLAIYSHLCLERFLYFIHTSSLSSVLATGFCSRVMQPMCLSARHFPAWSESHSQTLNWQAVAGVPSLPLDLLSSGVTVCVGTAKLTIGYITKNKVHNV